MKRALFICIASFFAITSTAQELSKKDIANMAEEQAAELKKEGWVTSAASLPLKYQFISSYTMRYEMINGDNKYLLADGKVEVLVQIAYVKAEALKAIAASSNNDKK